jgi:hypothetical protein
MGDRIYQGFRIATDSFAEALRIVDAFRPWVKEQSEKRLDTFMANVMKEDSIDFVAAFDMWQERRRRVLVEQCRMPAVDTDFTVVLVPAGGYLLGRVFTEQREWRSEWYKQPGVEEFSYWDNMEGPEDVSEEDWAARGKAWEIITDDPMSMQGFSIELVSPSGPMPKAWRRP